MAGIDSYTKLLLHCDGADGATTFSDDSGNGRTITRSGNTQIDTAQSKFGGASALFDGNGDYLSVADFAELDLGSADFTFDFWVRFNSGGNQNFFSRQDNGSPTSYLYCGYESATGGIRFRDYNADTINTTWAWAPSTGTWYHIAIIRYSNNVRCYVNGTQIGSAIACSGTFTARTTDLVIGGFTTAYFLNGWLDEFRFSPGIARWTANFTPETEEYGEEEPPELDYNASLSIADGWLIYASADTVPIDDTIRLLEEWSIEENPKSYSMTGTLSIADGWLIYASAEPVPIDDTIQLLEEWLIYASAEPVPIDDTIRLLEEWLIYANPQVHDIQQSLSLNDSWSVSFVERTIKFSTDFRWLTGYANKIKTSFDWILAKTITTDFRWLKTYTPTINTDFRWLSVGYNDVPPISPSDIQIFINSVDMVPLNEVDMQSGNIVHTAGQKSTATFTLARKHDDLDRTHTGAASQITNQNPVQIYIKGHLEFDGKISNLSVNSESETVQVTCQMNEPADNRHSIDLPLPSVNEKLHLYHCLLNNVQIDNPYIDPSEENPEYYKGIKVDLGTQIQQYVDSRRELEYIWDGKGDIATKVEEGTYLTRPNYTYFWSVLVKNARTGIYNGDFRYIGTSMASTTTDLWVINGASPLFHKVKDDVETELGFYYLGSAPYKEISCKNGKLIIAAKYQDREDGLYHVYDAHYDYINFAKIVAGLEYQKLLTVGGLVVPVTSANIDVTFDAYYYYTVKLLTRINVTNTTVANTFKNTNGFPVSVKGISINFSTMKITLTTDNRLSKKELDEIDARMPDEENPTYLVPAREARVYRKFDLKTWEFV